MQKVNKLHNLPCKLQRDWGWEDEAIEEQQLLLYKSGLLAAGGGD